MSEWRDKNRGAWKTAIDPNEAGMSDPFANNFNKE